MSDKKLGRPTNNPRLHKISIRLDDKSKEILNKYCLQENVNKTEAINRGIYKLGDDLKSK